MNRITEAAARLAQATDLPGVLDTAYESFEDMLAVLRRHQEDDEGAFPAFVMAACAAANGRDMIAWAPALQPAAPRERAGGLLDGASVAEVALAIASLSGELATRLTVLAGATGHPVDRNCCEHAAAEAMAIQALLGGANPP